MNLLLLLACTGHEPTGVTPTPAGRPSPAATAREPAATAREAAAAPAGAPAPSAARSKPGVDIYLSAGQRVGQGSCDSGENSLCELWHVRVIPGQTKAEEVERVVPTGTLGAGSSGAVEAALSPDETRIAWLERNRFASRLLVRKLPDGKPHVVVEPEALRGEGVGRGRPEWPEFARDDLLLYDGLTNERDGVAVKTVYSVPIADPAHPGPQKGQLGELGKDNNPWGLHDVAVWRGGSGIKLVGFGPVDGGRRRPLLVPRVLDLDADGAPKGPPSIFEMGVNESGMPITECHHPAWSYSGDRILCMVHEPAEQIDGVRTRMLYEWKLTDGKWTNPKRVFQPKPVDKAGIASDVLFQPRDYQHATYKYAQWCGSDDWVIANVFSSNRSEVRKGEDSVAARVMLIHTNPVEYFDVTSMIEQHEGLALGQMFGFTATCGRAR